jgi:hypothetical protein
MPQPYDSRFAPLVRKVVSGIFRKYEQGEFFMNKILPDTTVPSYHWTYNLYGNVGNSSEDVGPGAEPTISQFAYDEKDARAYEWRKEVPIADRDIMSIQGLRNVWADAAQQISEDILLSKEKKGLDALLGLDTTYNDIANHGMPTPISGSNWASPSSDIFKDLTNARKAVLKTAHKFPDTIIIGPDDQANIENHPDFRQWQLAGPFGQQNLAMGAIGKIKGMDVFVMTAVADVNPNYPHVGDPNDQRPQVGTTSGYVAPLLEGKAIVCKRGRELGYMGVAEPFQTVSLGNDGGYYTRRRMQSIMGWHAAGPAIERPNHLVHIYTDGSEPA